MILKEHETKATDYLEFNYLKQSTDSTIGISPNMNFNLEVVTQ